MAELGPRSSLAYRESTMFIFFRSSLNFPQRLMYDSRARAIAHGNMTLPTVRSQSDIQALVDYLDGVFATRRSIASWEALTPPSPGRQTKS